MNMYHDGVDESTMGAAIPAAVAARDELAERTRDFAARLYEMVAADYLQFRRTYYHEAMPSLATTPPAHSEIHKAEIALVAENTLRLLPGAVKALPVLGGVIEHLQQVTDLNSVAETERTALHNMTMAFLYGVKGGIQPWYVAWVLASARRLSTAHNADYFMEFPWDACLYMTPDELTQFAQAADTGDVAGIAGIEVAMQRIAERLSTALKNPVDAQFEFAFCGPDADRRRVTFRLKTAATLALGAYLLSEEVRMLPQPRAPHTAPASLLEPLPPELTEHMAARATASANTALH